MPRSRSGLLSPHRPAFSRHAVGLVASVPVLGDAVGLVLLVPTADLIESRRIILSTLVAGVVALAAVAIAPSTCFFLFAAFASSAGGLAA